MRTLLVHSGTLLMALNVIITVAACTLRSGVTPIAYEDLGFTQAVARPDADLPVKLVPIPEPVPLPAQLKLARKLEVKPAKSENGQDTKSRIDDANDAAKIEPSEDGYINAIQTYPYMKGALYQLYAAVNQVTDIALEPGENLLSVSAGDTVRWIVGDTVSGSGENSQVHILVKPIAADLQTNLVITTDRRTYHLELHSGAKTYMASISWVYPRSELLALEKSNARAFARAKQTIDANLNLHRLNFRYRITGDAPWKPVRAFDDGAKVYLQFPASIARVQAPPLFVVGEDSQLVLVNYRVKDNYYIVDRLFAIAELRLGTKRQQIVRITRVGVATRRARSIEADWGFDNGH